MMKVLTDIPGFERRQLHCICSNDDLSKILFAGKLIGELRSKYGTSVAYFSTRSTSEAIEDLQGQYDNPVGKLYATDLENNDCMDLCRKIQEMVNQRFVRAVVIDCLEGLDLKEFDGGVRARRDEIKTKLYMTAAACNIPILLFCPRSRSHKDKTEEYDAFMAEVLPQLRKDL